MRVNLEIGSFYIRQINTKFPLLFCYVRMTNRYAPKGSIGVSNTAWIRRLEKGDPRDNLGRFKKLSA
jgi:hypothetical protein